MTIETDTPQTDAEEVWAEWNGQEFKAVHASFARKLERQRDELVSALEACIAAISDHEGRENYWDGIRNAREQARAALSKAGVGE